MSDLSLSLRLDVIWSVVLPLPQVLLESPWQREGIDVVEADVSPDHEAAHVLERPGLLEAGDWVEELEGDGG